MAEDNTDAADEAALQARVDKHNTWWGRAKAAGIFLVVLPLVIVAGSLCLLGGGWLAIQFDSPMGGSLAALLGAIGIIVAMGPLALLQNVANFATAIFDNVGWLKAFKDKVPDQITTFGRMFSIFAALMGLLTIIPAYRASALIWLHFPLSITLLVVFYMFALREAKRDPEDELSKNLASSGRLMGTIAKVAIVVAALSAIINVSPEAREVLLDQGGILLLVAIALIYVAAKTEKTKITVFSLLGAAVACGLAVVMVTRDQPKHAQPAAVDWTVIAEQAGKSKPPRYVPQAPSSTKRPLTRSEFKAEFDAIGIE